MIYWLYPLQICHVRHQKIPVVPLQQRSASGSSSDGAAKTNEVHSAVEIRLGCAPRQGGVFEWVHSASQRRTSDDAAPDHGSIRSRGIDGNRTCSSRSPKADLQTRAPSTALRSIARLAGDEASTSRRIILSARRRPGCSHSGVLGRNLVRSSLTWSGRSSWAQWPAPSTIWTPLNWV